MRQVGEEIVPFFPHMLSSGPFVTLDKWLGSNI
jgi:hypothetical protein